MNPISLCNQGLIFVLWSELVLEGVQCIFEFVKSLSATSKHGSKILKATASHDNILVEKEITIQRSDCFFTNVLFFPDHEAITGLLRKDDSDNWHRAFKGAATTLNCLDKNISPSATQNDVDAPCNISHIDQNTYTKHCGERLTDNSLLENNNRGSPPKKRGALEEMVRCLDGAVSSLDVCVLLLTCDRLIAPLLQAKDRGVRVRVLLDRSMAAVDGSLLPQLRKCNIPVRLLPSSNIISGNSNNIAARGGVITAFEGDAVKHQKLDTKQQCSNSIGCSKRAGVSTTVAAFSSGLMHHKFAVIDAWKENTQKSENVEHVLDDNHVLIGCGDRSDDDIDQRNRSNGANRISEEWYHGDIAGYARPLVITGSFNWTWSAVTTNNENVIISNRPELVVPFSDQFQQLWRQAL